MSKLASYRYVCQKNLLQHLKWSKYYRRSVTTTPNQEVLHSSEKNEFYMGHGEDKAVLQYKQIGDSTIELEHTVVPGSLKGKGAGKALADAALQYALRKNLKVKVTCGFVQKYIEKYPKTEFKKILLK